LGLGHGLKDPTPRDSQERQFGLKKGRCHTCLSRLPDDKTYALPSSNCLSEVNIHLDAPRCSLCFEVAKTFNHYQRATLTPEEARTIFPKLEHAVSLTHGRKERNEDEIPKVVEDDLDYELKGLKEMLEMCRPPNVEERDLEETPRLKTRSFEGARDVAFGRLGMREERSGMQFSRVRGFMGFVGSIRCIRNILETTRNAS
jgi:hypothetical protein